MRKLWIPMLALAGVSGMAVDAAERLELLAKPASEITCKPVESVQSGNGKIVFTAAQPEASVFFGNIPTDDPAASYLVQVGLAGDAGVKVFSYLENSSNGWQNAGMHMECSGDPALIQYIFSPKEEIKAPSYLGVVMKSEGNLTVNAARVIKIGQGIVTGGDFEQDADLWELKRNATIARHGDSGVLEIESPDEGAVGEALSPLIEVKPSTHYELAYEVSGVEKSGTNLLQDFKVIPLFQDNPMLAADDVWVQCLSSRQTKTLKFKTGQGQNSLRLKVVVKAPGCVRFDNFTLAESTPELIPAEIVLDMPFNHGNGVFASNPQEAVTGRVTVNAPQAAAYELVLTDAAKRELWRQAGKAASGVEFSLPVPAPGTSDTLRLTLLAENGDTLFTAEQEIAHHAARADEVTFRDDGVTLVNGKPFFMIAHWWFTRRGDTGANVDWWYENDADAADDMDFLREAGFNTILIRYPRQIEMAREHGLKAIIEYPHTIKGETAAEKEAVRQQFFAENRSYNTNPALLAYFGPDEVMLRGIPVPQVLEGSQLVREADPYHPIFYNEAPCGTAEDQREYTVIGDVVGRDIYPVGAPHGDLLSDRTLTAVGKHADICHESVDHNKPVWMILQALGWAHIQAGNNTKTPDQLPELVYPTYEQDRFMAYNAILHGATGIMYHYLGYTVHVPDGYWEGLRRVLLELEYMSDVYTARTVRDPALHCAQPEIRFLVKEHQGAHYYLIANESAQAVNAEFSGCPEKSLHVLFESAPVAVTDGKFTLALPPYAVKVMSSVPFKSAEEIFKMDCYVPYSAQPVLRGKQ